jgi:hypothetical protein
MQTGLRNRFSSIILILIKKKDQNKPVNNIMFLNFHEANRMKLCTVLNKNEDMVIREQLMEFQINVS